MSLLASVHTQQTSSWIFIRTTLGPFTDSALIVLQFIRGRSTLHVYVFITWTLGEFSLIKTLLTLFIISRGKIQMGKADDRKLCCLLYHPLTPGLTVTSLIFFPLIAHNNFFTVEKKKKNHADNLTFSQQRGKINCRLDLIDFKHG